MSDKSMGLRQETPRVIDHIDRMARPANEGKWRRRALSVTKHIGAALKGAGTLGQAVIETRAGKIIAATALGLAATQTPVGKDVTHRVVEGAQGAVNTTSEVFDDWMFGPKMENNDWAVAADKRYHKQEPLKQDEYFEKDMKVTTTDPLQSRVDVYPINSNFARGVPVIPIGTIPAGTRFERVLMTPAEFAVSGTNDYSKSSTDPAVTGYVRSETWGAFDCNSVESVFQDRNGDPVTDLSKDYPVCVVRGINLEKAPK